MSNSKPFGDLKFCCTSVPSGLRLDISSKIKSMGGIYCNNLMSDVNVLIVGDRNTDKYRFSAQKRFDIVFIKPEAIVELHEKWISGENILNLSSAATMSSKTLASGYLRFIPRMPIFEGLTICLSRIPSPSNNSGGSGGGKVPSKAELAEIINLNGGNSTDSLTIHTSFLITTERSGKRFEKAIEWKIPVVHPNWVTDSLRRGASLESDYYNVTLFKDYSKIGKGACLIWNELKEFSHKHSSIGGSANQNNSTSKKRRLVTDDAEDSTLRKLFTVPQDIDEEEDEEEDVGDFDEIRQTKVNSTSLSAWDSIINNFNKPTASQILGNNTKRTKLSNETKIAKNKKQSASKPKADPQKNDKRLLFKGLKFSIFGFDSIKSSTLTKIIKSHSGEANVILNEIESLFETDYIVIPHSLLDEDIMSKAQLLSKQNKYLIVTEWFIERCLYYNEIKYDIWGQPLTLNKQIRENRSATTEEVGKLQVSISGFSGIELLHLEKLLASLDHLITFNEKLTKNTHLLLINSSLIGLNEDNSKPLFENNPELVKVLIKDMECNKISLQSMKKKLVFCQTNGLPIYSINFLFELAIDWLSKNSDDVTKGAKLNKEKLSDLRWCIYYPKHLNQKADHFLYKFVSTLCEESSASTGENKTKRKEWGKLSGKASESSLNQRNDDLVRLNKGQLAIEEKDINDDQEGKSDEENKQSNGSNQRQGSLLADEDAKEDLATQIVYGKERKISNMKRNRSVDIY